MHIAFESREGDDPGLSAKIKQVLKKGADVGQHTLYWVNFSSKEVAGAVIGDGASEQVALLCKSCVLLYRAHDSVCEGVRLYWHRL